MKATLYGIFCGFLLLVSCRNEHIQKPENPLFTALEAAQTGISFANTLTDTDKINILDYLYYYNGGGVAAADFNLDGKIDLFFTGNQVKNRLYVNKGNFLFEDITEKAGVGGYADWKTGVTIADVNADGYPDIYVCAVGNYKGLEGANELYINNGDLTFTEKAADYGLDFTGFSTQAVFFDYDKDGDLDCYLLNHAVHTSRSYDRVTARNLRNNESGDYLFRNETIPAKDLKGQKPAKIFTNVSEQAGIFGAAMGYGLGVIVADLNNDGWDDLYIGNDFHEDDYYYINNRNGTFTESLKSAFGHISRFTMGCDAADLNNDGYIDLMSLDMYPEDETVEKSSVGEDPFDIYQFKLAYGFAYQFSRNCLQLNLGGKKFAEIASLAGVSATDWSWSTLLADYDNDGRKDIFVTNGIPRRPNNLDYINFLANDSLRKAIGNPKEIDRQSIELMPEGKTRNYIFKGEKDYRFSDRSADWGFQEADFSNGAVYVDLDNDGDLDLVTNRINQAAGVYRNNAEKNNPNNWLSVAFKGDSLNRFGIGAKVFAKANGQTQMQQLTLTRGFLSAVAPVLHFGLGDASIIDSLVVIWPDFRTEIKTKVAANQALTLNIADAQLQQPPTLLPLFPPQEAPLFTLVNVPIDWQHRENTFFDFNREPLIPFKVSTEGPKIAVGDINGDGLEDLYLCGAKYQSGAIYVQTANGFSSLQVPDIVADSIYEDVAALFFDADGDGDQDLYVVSGGNEFFGQMEEQYDRLYRNDGKGNFTRDRQALPPMPDNKSCVRVADFDSDGDPDLFVGGRVIANAYGRIPRSYLLQNDGKGNFKDVAGTVATGLADLGMVTDARWTDLNGDRQPDLVVVGDWMSPTVFLNQKGKLTIAQDNGLQNLNGFWQTVANADLDGDGDMDLLVGNIGLNTKLIKDPNPLLQIFVKDFDKNGKDEQIIAYNRGKKLYPIAFKDELGKQIPSIINKKFTSYAQYAGKTLGEILDEKFLQDATRKSVNTFTSMWLRNDGKGNFTPIPLPAEAQMSKIFVFHVADVNRDNLPDILIGGNLYGVSTYQGRYDAFCGLVLLNEGSGNWRSLLPHQSGWLTEGEVRDIRPITIGEAQRWLVARNNEALLMLR
ncbi:VCBS repeat-containing protein [Rhodoflexus sp.]